MTRKSVCRGLALVGLLAGCASTSPVQGRLAATQAAVRAADEVGANTVPRAALHLQLAREEIEQAKKLIRTREGIKADFVLQRAQADAELALVLAKEAPVKAQTQEMLDKLEASNSPAAGE
jgi:hypothetical protein